MNKYGYGAEVQLCPSTLIKLDVTQNNTFTHTLMEINSLNAWTALSWISWRHFSSDQSQKTGLKRWIEVYFKLIWQNNLWHIWRQASPWSTIHRSAMHQKYTLIESQILYVCTRRRVNRIHLILLLKFYKSDDMLESIVNIDIYPAGLLTTVMCLLIKAFSEKRIRRHLLEYRTSFCLFRHDPSTNDGPESELHHNT